MFGDENPLMKGGRRRPRKAATERNGPPTRRTRSCSPENCGRATSRSLRPMRDSRDALYETTFLAIYGSPVDACASARSSPSSAPEGSARSCASCPRFRRSCSARPRRLRRGGDPHADPAGESRAPSGATGSSDRPRSRPRRAVRLARTGQARARSSANRRSSSNSSRERAIDTLPELLPEQAERRARDRGGRVHRRRGRGDGARHDQARAGLPFGARPRRPRPARGAPGPADARARRCATISARRPAPLEAVAAIVPEAVAEQEATDPAPADPAAKPKGAAARARRRNNGKDNPTGAPSEAPGGVEVTRPGSGRRSSRSPDARSSATARASRPRRRGTTPRCSAPRSAGRRATGTLVSQ